MLRAVFLMISLLPVTIFGQSDVEMADSFRGEGKIYVVIAVILTILTGIVIVLWRLDRRTKKLEEESSK